MLTTSHVTLIRVQELNPVSNERNVIIVLRSVGQWDTSRYISDMSHDLKCALSEGAAVRGSRTVHPQLVLLVQRVKKGPSLCSFWFGRADLLFLCIHMEILTRRCTDYPLRHITRRNSVRPAPLFISQNNFFTCDWILRHAGSSLCRRAGPLWMLSISFSKGHSVRVKWWLPQIGLEKRETHWAAIKHAVVHRWRLQFITHL